MSLPSQSDVEQVADSARALLADGWEPWPGGQKGKIKLALIDAVFSIRARYGQPSDAETGRNATGVPAIVDQWRKRPGVDGVDDLRHLSSTSETDLLAVLRNRSRTSGRTKAAAVIDASASLEGVGIVHAAEFIAGASAARKAYVRVHGLGWVTFTYMCMLLGVHDVKADVWIVRFVQDALRRDVDNAYTRAVMLSVAEVFAGEEGRPAQGRN